MSIAPAGSSSNSVHKNLENQDKPLALQFSGGIGGVPGHGGGRVVCVEPELVDSVSLSLSFSHSLHDLPISVFSQVVFFLLLFFVFPSSFFPEFSRHLLDRAQT